jgi:hypothetical protein
VRPLALAVAFAVVAACGVAGVPSTRVIAGTDDVASIAAEPRGTDEDAPTPVDPSDRDEDSESETEDSTDDADMELLAVLPPVLSLAITRGHAQRWLRTSARRCDDPELPSVHRPPITA